MLDVESFQMQVAAHETVVGLWRGENLFGEKIEEEMGWPQRRCDVQQNYLCAQWGNQLSGTDSRSSGRFIYLQSEKMRESRSRSFPNEPRSRIQKLEV